MFRRVSLRAALAAVAAPVVLTGLVAGPAAGPAHADDGGGRTGTAGSPEARAHAPAPHAARQESVRALLQARRAKRAKAARAEADTPLAVTIDQLTPSTIPAKGVVRVSGTVTNNDDVTWTTINVRPFISAEPMTSVAELAAAASTPADAVVGDRINDEQHKYLIPELAPGEHAAYSFDVPRKDLGADAPGVYWFGVHALGESPAGRDEYADGRARTFLPLVPPARQGRLPTAVVIPLRHTIDHADDGSVDDLAGWTKTLSAGGRLRALVDFGAGSGDRSVTWVVDPALVDAVRRLADGNPPRSLEPNLQAGQADGEDAPSGEASGSPSASGSASPSDGATPSAAPEDAGDNPLDLDALDPVVQAAAEAAQDWLTRLGAAMRPEDQVMTLPYGDVDVAGAAAHDPQLLQQALARSGTSLPGFDVTTTPVVVSPSGFLTTAGIEASGQGTTVLLSDAMFDAPAPAVATTAGHQVVVTSSGAAAGGPGPDSRTGLTAMRQRLLSEAAVRFLHADHQPLTMVLPHDWNPDGAQTFFGGLDVPWLDLTTVDSVSRTTTPAPVVGTLRYPAFQQAVELDQPAFDAAESLERSGTALQNLLTLNNLVAGTVADEALASVSYSARTHPVTSRLAADRSRAWIEERLGRVRVSAPRAVTLSSSSGKFQATVTNDLDQPVTVALDADSDDRLGIEGPRRIEVAANSREAVILTARTGENGIHQVTLMVTDKRGTPLGGRTTLTIRSAQVSNVIWLFMGIGAALLFGAILLRLVRRVRGARRSPAASGAAPPGPPDPAGVGREPAGAGSR